MTLAAATAVALGACDANDPGTPGGTVNISIQQSLTGQTTSAGTFTLSGAVSDDGATSEEVAFGGALTNPVVPITFRRVLTGKKGTLTVAGNATLSWTSQTTGALTGTWSVESATGVYVKGGGTLSGSANFGATPPTATMTYTGTINR